MANEEQLTPEQIAEQEQAATDAAAAAQQAEDEGTMTPEEIADLKKKATDAQAIADDLKDKNEKLFERNKKLEKQRDEALGGLKPLDVLTLTQANVHTDDIEEVVNYAKYKNISVADALKDSTLKGMIDVRVQERRTAEATNTRGGARGTNDVTGEALLSSIESGGDVPETDEGMNKLFLARQQRRLNSRPTRRT